MPSTVAASRMAIKSSMAARRRATCFICPTGARSTLPATRGFSDMELSTLYKPDLAFLPIGDFYTMGRGAALPAVAESRMVPMHSARSLP